MTKEYKKHITSDSQHQVWLHRTHSSNIDGILRKGLRFGTDLSNTATLQPTTLEEAENSYKTSHKGNNAVVVIKIPRNIADRYYSLENGVKGLRHQGYEGDKEVTYWEDGGFYVQRKHVHGWIDKKTEEYHANPFLTEPQELTEKHFPAQLYGGLEKDLITQTEPPKPNLRKSNKKSRAGELPPPPKFIRAS